MAANTKIKTCTAGTREQWRAWLEKHHATESKVWLISQKRHTGKPALSHREAMEVAICFGWIDTIVKRLDHDRYMRCFVKRTKNSRWSKNTLSYAKDMVKKGEMAAAGMQRYREGLKKPVIDHGLPRNPDVPKILKQALAKDSKARIFFESLAPSYRRTYIYWIERAKMDETKQKRVRTIIEKCRQGKRVW